MMNNVRIFLLMALLAMAGNASADELVISDFSISPGETKTISIALDNPTNDYIAFEFWMRLPDGVRIVYDDDDFLMATLNSSRADRHELEVKEPDNDGVYHFLCYSNRNNTFREKSGEIISLTVKCAEDAVDGSYEASLYNLIFSDPNKVQVDLPDVSFDITIVGVSPGDANGDGNVTIADAVAVVNYILGNHSDFFVFNAANVDGDSEITISDAFAIVNIILNQ